MAAILHVAAHVGQIHQQRGHLVLMVLSISPICAAMIASTHDDKDESPVVKGS
jgi:hypothetical protein